jgi:hypothetical protein
LQALLAQPQGKCLLLFQPKKRVVTPPPKKKLETIAVLTKTLKVELKFICNHSRSKVSKHREWNGKKFMLKKFSLAHIGVGGCRLSVCGHDFVE